MKNQFYGNNTDISSYITSDSYLHTFYRFFISLHARYVSNEKGSVRRRHTILMHEKVNKLPYTDVTEQL